MAAKSCISLILSTLLLSLQGIYGHSWLHCTDYRADITGQDYDDSECEGYIRDWQNGWNSPSFSQDLGINYFGANGAWCQTGFSSNIGSMYTDSYPYADWYVGETYRMVWPAKNHANYDCFANIPDTSMKLYYNPTVNPSSDGTTLGSDWIVLHDFQDGCTAGTDGCGFQNCPKFCEDTDGAPCYGDYTVDDNMFSSSGFYSIMWYWIFNPGSPYVTCFEVYVHKDGNAPTPPPTTPSPTTESEEFETTTTTEEGGNNGGNGGSSSPDYIVQIPICYSGAPYNEDTLEDGANDAFDDDDEIDFSVISYIIRDSTNNIWNATIQTSTHDSILVTDSALSDDEELCDSIEDSFGIGSCYVCDEGAIRVFYASSTDDGNNNNSGGSSNDDSDAAVTILWAIILTIVILLLIFGCCYLLKKKNYIVFTNNSISWQGSNGGSSAQTTAATINSGATTTGAAGAHAPKHIRAVPSASALATHDHQSHQVVPDSRPARPVRPPPVPTH